MRPSRRAREHAHFLRVEGIPDLAALHPEIVAEQRKNILRFLAGLVVGVAVSLLLVFFAEGLLQIVGLVGLVVCAVHIAVPVYWYMDGYRVE